MTKPEQEVRVFGPVPSRRLGRSLGVDPVPFKTCSFDCVYCQLGRTTRRTIERETFVPIEPLVEQVKSRLDAAPDFITLSGSGEPTLHAGCRELIAALKSLGMAPVAVLTNASLFHLPAVREAVAQADLVVPSLDAGDPETFRRVNRPHPDVSFDAMAEGLASFRSEFAGTLWLEVFLLDGMNADDAQVDGIAEIAKRIAPDRVQLNTVSRPPAEAFAKPVPRERLETLAKRFEPAAEVIADFRGVHERLEFAARREDVLEMLKRRPCTVTDLAAGLGLHVNEVVKYVEELETAGRISVAESGERRYYAARPESS